MSRKDILSRITRKGGMYVTPRGTSCRTKAEAAYELGGEDARVREIWSAVEVLDHAGLGNEEMARVLAEVLDDLGFDKNDVTSALREAGGWEELADALDTVAWTQTAAKDGPLMN